MESGPVLSTLKSGTIGGIFDAGTGLSTFLGIPYAKPPVGELRGKAPQALDSWSGVLETREFGPNPVQNDVFRDMVFRSPGEREDCLYLNVWTPAKDKSEKLPVLVYFYGGGFVAGDGYEPRNDGASMAQKGIVTLTVNSVRKQKISPDRVLHRLSPLVHPMHVKLNIAWEAFI